MNKGTEVGRLRELESIEGTLVQDDYELGRLAVYIGHEERITGAVVVVDGRADYAEVWVTGYSAPYLTTSVYERVV